MATGVVFIHGMWSQRAIWDRWLPAFVERGYVCDAVTLPGHHAGAREEELVGVGFDECVDAAARSCARFAHPILIGHSLGGLIAQKLATRITPRAVVMINSAAPRAVFPLRSANVRGLSRHFVRWGLWRDLLRLSPDEADHLLFGALPQPARDRAHAELLPESGRLAYQLGFGRLSTRAHDIDRQALRAPMLALAGTRDNMIPVAVSRAMAHYYGRAVDYREYDNAHWLLGEAGYRERMQEILSWLRALGAEDALASAHTGGPA